VTPRRNPWSGARNFGLAGVANSAQTLDLPLLTLVGGPVASGLYGAVSRWTQPMSLLATAFASASAPFAANAGTMRGALASLRRGLWMPVAAIVLALTVFALSPWIVDLLLGQTYEGSAAVLRIAARRRFAVPPTRRLRRGRIVLVCARPTGFGYGFRTPRGCPRRCPRFPHRPGASPLRALDQSRYRVPTCSRKSARRQGR
jgi:hypothetical protein